MEHGLKDSSIKEKSQGFAITYFKKETLLKAKTHPC